MNKSFSRLATFALAMLFTSVLTADTLPEPTHCTRFDSDHTIICYGDSLTFGSKATTVTMDDRGNYFDGRLEGQKVEQGYPYWLSGMIPSEYNVIHQARGGAQTCNITAWSGEQVLVVTNAFTLPASGSVPASSNIVYDACTWGWPYGGWSLALNNDTSWQATKYMSDWWYGVTTPVYPLYEEYGTATIDSITGVLGNRRVRLQGASMTNVTITVLTEASTDEVIPVGTRFIPDSETIPLYSNAVHIFSLGANDFGCDVYDSDDDTYLDKYKKHLKPLLLEVAARGDKFLIVSPCYEYGSKYDNNTVATPTEYEKMLAADFGDNYLNLRMKMNESAKETSEALGASFRGDDWSVLDDTGTTGLMCEDATHFNYKGYKVKAEFIRQKLVALGYVHEHDWSDWVVDVEPQVNMLGHKYRQCSECGAIEEVDMTAITPLADPSWGYKVSGLGAACNEVALVFTNHNATISWTVPQTIENVQFLVVGGGGGGGADSDADESKGYGGAGGGGGGVIVGSVNDAVSQGTVVTVKVGAGGAGGKLATDSGASQKGGASSIAVGDSTTATTIVYADGGGCDGGYPNPGGAGGSYGGCRTNAYNTVVKPNTYSDYDDSLVTAVMYGNSGGVAYASTKAVSGGGGGGATTKGGNSMGSSNTNNTYGVNVAGQGGEGLASSITGTTVVYGSGGGGGTTTTGAGLAAPGGTNAGNGAGINGTTANSTVTSLDGGDGVANCGGGGGGGGGGGNGGDGGSGIVVIRYVDTNLHVHVWSDWTTKTAATCTTTGEKTRSCTADGCSDPVVTQTAVILALGHSWGDWSVVTPAQVGVAGLMRRECANCDAVEESAVPALTATAPLENASWGYTVTGLGASGNEVAVVFTNVTEAMTWTAPMNLENVQFLVVGGGGGGGGDSNSASGGQGGAGGGGGGVITGYINSVSAGVNLAVVVGAGGAGGALSTTPTSANYQETAVKGGTSSVSLGTTVLVSAEGGGCATGAYNKSIDFSGVGGSGGSNAGSRTTSCSSTAPNYSSVTNTEYVVGEMFGKQGGVAYASSPYASGGGGGALEEGGTSSRDGINLEVSTGYGFWQGGKGGEGLLYDITGTSVVYGSGGGGGAIFDANPNRVAGGYGGEGAGDGKTVGNGEDALATQGGGGGGAGDQGSGGNGGSGIVVLRFVNTSGADYDFSIGTTEIIKPDATTGDITIPYEFTITGDSLATQTNLFVSVYRGETPLVTTQLQFNLAVGQSSIMVTTEQLSEILGGIQLQDGVYGLEFTVKNQDGVVLAGPTTPRTMLLIGELTPVDKPVVNAVQIYDGTAKTCVSSGTGYTLSGTSSATDTGVYLAVATLDAGCVWSDGSSEPYEISWSISKFDSDHTIICYGDSLTSGTKSGYAAMARMNFFDGRLYEHWDTTSYPFWLSGMIPESYNVIHQALGGVQTCNVASWSGDLEVVVTNGFTLPATGSVTVSKTFVFKDCSYGPYGGAVTKDDDWSADWFGLIMPKFSLHEEFTEPPAPLPVSWPVAAFGCKGRLPT